MGDVIEVRFGRARWTRTLPKGDLRFCALASRTLNDAERQMIGMYCDSQIGAGGWHLDEPVIAFRTIHSLTKFMREFNR